MLLGLASTVNAQPLPPISDRHGVRLPEPRHCLTNVNFGIVPNALPEGFDDFEEQPHASTSTSNTANVASQQSNETGTQGSSLFDTNATTTTRGRNEDDEYDDDEEEGGDDGDVSMTTVHPSQSQGGMGATQEGEKKGEEAGEKEKREGEGEGDEAQRGVKRSLDEDEDYD